MLASTTWVRQTRARLQSGHDLAPSWFHGVRFGIWIIALAGCAGDLPPSETDRGPWTFVSAPDWLNEDVGHFASLDPRHKGTTDSLELVLSELLDDMTSHDPAMVLVAGDLVGGHWSAPPAMACLPFEFDTDEGFLRAAATMYYGDWKRRFQEHGIETVYAAVGDHDLGDNPWPAGSTRARQLATYREVFADQFTRDGHGDSRFDEEIYPGIEARPVGSPQEDTAYAVRFRNLLLVTLDVFDQPNPGRGGLSQGSVQADVNGRQLAWLEALLSAADSDPNLDHVVVQGHVPILGPVRLQSSSGITLEGGEASQLWRVLSSHNVSAYLAGEVHAVSAIRASDGSGPVQLTHGRPPTYGGSNYLVLTVDGDVLQMRLHAVEIQREGDEMFCSVDGSKAGRTRISGPVRQVGTLVLRRNDDGITVEAATGWLELIDRDVPLLHYTADEARGPLHNVGSFGNVLYALPLPKGSERVDGVTGSALRLHGSGTQPTGAGSPLRELEPRTLALWLRSRATHLQDVAGWGSSDRSFWLQTSAEGVRLRTGPHDWLTADAPGLLDGTWHHVAIVVPEMEQPTLDDVKVYVDGAALRTHRHGARALPKTTVNPGFRLGDTGSSHARPFEGDLDEVQVFARPLDAGQVARLHGP